MIPRPPNRIQRTRPAHTGMGLSRPESLAAEFALLTQRRSRALHEIEMLDQQRATAAVNFGKLQQRIGCLMQQMDALSPDPRETPPEVVLEVPPETAPEPSAPGSRKKPPASRPIASKPIAPNPAASNSETFAAIGRQWMAIAQAAQATRPTRPRRGRTI